MRANGVAAPGGGATMLERGDLFVYVIIALFIVCWGVHLWKKNQPSTSSVPKSGKLVSLLEAEGYDIVSGKMKIPLRLSVGEREMDSAITADYLVEQNGRTYIVVKEKEEDEKLTAKYIKERYLVDCLTFRADGLIVINSDKTRVKQIDVSVKSPTTYSRLKLGVICFLLGAAMTFFWTY